MLYISNIARCPVFIRVVVFTCPAPQYVFNSVNIIVVVVVKVTIVEDAGDARLGVVGEWEDAILVGRGWA